MRRWLTEGRKVGGGVKWVRKIKRYTFPVIK